MSSVKRTRDKHSRDKCLTVVTGRTDKYTQATSRGGCISESGVKGEVK